MSGPAVSGMTGDGTVVMGSPRLRPSSTELPPSNWTVRLTAAVAGPHRTALGGVLLSAGIA